MAAARPAKSDQSHSSSTYVGIGNSDLFTITRSSDLHFEVLRGGGGRDRIPCGTRDSRADE